MKLKEIAHSRTGDKGEISNISVIPYDESDYDYIKEQLTAERVKNYFCEICKGEVTCYEVPGVRSLNFVLDRTLGGGVTRSLAIDKHGKSLGMALLEMELGDSLIPQKSESAKEKGSEWKPTGRTIRIGSGAGYAGDRVDPAMELLEKGELDYIIFECLAERTIAIGQKNKQQNPDLGYNSLLEYRMEKILPLLSQKKVKMITNMGAANPKAAAKKIIEIAGKLGVTGLHVAYVTGDDIYDSLDDFRENVILENGMKQKDFPGEIISANAYMGADAIVNALKVGADIIVTGRVSDPALTIGPLVYEFGWTITDHAEQMGQAVLAGHLLECAGQVTGGYYADPGYKDVKDLANLGFPIVEICESGEFVVTKVNGSGGAVTVDTCKEQMIYEIHNPKAYLTPDAIADFSGVTFAQVEKDVVKASGATSYGIPESLKVSLGYRDCYISEGEISYGGSNCIERAKLAERIIRERLPMFGDLPEEFRVDYIGVNSLYMNSISSQISMGSPAEVRIRFSARYSDKKTAELFANDVETLYTNGPAGGGGVTTKVTEVLSICSIFVPREKVNGCVHKLGW